MLNLIVWLNFHALWALTCDFLLPSCESYYQTKQAYWTIIKIRIIFVYWPQVFTFILFFRPKRGKGLRGMPHSPMKYRKKFDNDLFYGYWEIGKNVVEFLVILKILSGQEWINTPEREGGEF